MIGDKSLFDFNLPNKAFFAITEEFISCHDHILTSAEDSWFNTIHPNHEVRATVDGQLSSALNPDSVSAFKCKKSMRVSCNTEDRVDSDNDDYNASVSSSKENTGTNTKHPLKKQKTHNALDNGIAAKRKSTITMSSSSCKTLQAGATKAKSFSASSHATTKCIQSKKEESPSKTSASNLLVKPTKLPSKAVDLEEESLKALLRQHNQKHVPKSLYTPALYSVRQVRTWEVTTGKSWQELSPNAKTAANQEIAEMNAKKY